MLPSSESSKDAAQSAITMIENEATGKPNLLLHVWLLLKLLVNGRVRARQVLVWTIFVLFAPMLSIVLLVVLRNTGVLTTDDVRIENTTYLPVPLSYYSEEPLANWQADASLLGFGPSGSATALALGASVCARLGVDFAETIKVADDKAATELGTEAVEAVVLFNTDADNKTSVVLYHTFLLSQNKYTSTVQTLVGDHQIKGDEVAAAAGLINLQAAANLAIIEAEGAAVPTGQPDFALLRGEDPLIEFPNYSASFSYMLFLFFGASGIMNTISSGIATQTKLKIPQTLELKGMIPYAYLLAWFFMAAAMSTIQSVLVVTLGYIVGIFQYTNAGLLFGLFFFHGWALCAFACFYVSLFGRVSFPVAMNGLMFLVNLAFIVAMIATLLTVINIFDPTDSDDAIIPVFLIPSVAFGYVIAGVPLSEDDQTNVDSISTLAGTAVGMLAVDVVLYLTLAMGVVFLYQIKRKSGKRKVVSESSDSRGKGIYVENLVKIFKVDKEYEVERKDCLKRSKTVTKKKKERLRAVDGLSLDIVSDQIFCLLGQNGAGKTTSFSLLTGSMIPSSGRITIVGKDMRVGLCPQHDVLFDMVSCQYQLELMGRIGGMSNEAARKEAIRLLEHLGIEQKAGEIPSNLSGGQKRRLTVALAVIGNSKILFMDEPTTGLDPVNRRRIWELLREMRRKGRTIILTTHSMEEAEALGDRIAIMSKGQLQAAGTSVELRQHYGPWYHLSCVRQASSGTLAYNPDKLHAFIKQKVPSAEVMSVVGSQVSINLPIEFIDEFPVLFDELEAEMNSFGISSFQVSPSTLDDVFMRLAAEEQEKEEAAAAETKVEVGEKLPKAFSKKDIVVDAKSLNFELKPNWKRQMKAMIRMSFRHITRTGDTFLTFLFNVVMMNVLAVVLQIAFIQDSSADPVNLNQGIQSSYSSVDPSLEGNATEFMGAAGLFYYNFTSFTDVSRLLLGGPRETIVFNSDPELLNLTVGYGQYNEGNMILEAVQLVYDQFANTSSVDPVGSFTYQPWRRLATSNDQFATNSMHLVAIAAAALSIIPAVDIIVSNYERLKETLLLQGLPRRLYWGSYFVVHASVAMLGHFIQYFILYVGGLNAVTKAPIVPYILLWIVSTPCLILYAYVWASFYGRKQRGDSVGFFICTLPILPWALASFAFDEPILPFENAMTIITPGFGFFRVFAAFQVAAFNGKEPTLSESLEWDFGVSQVLVMMVIATMLYALYLYFVEFIGIRKVVRSCKPNSKVDAVYSKDEIGPVGEDNVNDVLAGILPKPVSALPEGVNKSDLVVEADNAGKYFKGVAAVANATLGTTPGNIFGLLGPNGAGKTTLIKCISGMDGYALDEGDAKVKNISIVSKLDEARVYMGVCPQFDALFQTLSPREHLIMFCNLRGVPEDIIGSLVDVYLQDLDLKLKADSWVKNLSGGNKRKTSIALSMVANPPAVFLDEPTTGIDPSTKHAIWEFLVKSSTAESRSVVLTTHSMEEADALCSRLAIMVQASIRTSGTPEELKMLYGGGLVAALSVAKSAVDNAKEYATAIVSKAHPEAKCIYEDERSQSHLFKFSLPNDTKWSHMFETMRNAEHLVDFSLAQKSLEDVFVQLAELQAGRMSNT